MCRISSFSWHTRANDDYKNDYVDNNKDNTGEEEENEEDDVDDDDDGRVM